MALVEIRKVSKVYQKGHQTTRLFENINLEIDAGEFLVLMGPRASGKSVLLTLIAGMEEPTKGTITIGGEEITAMSPCRLAAWRTDHIGFIFESTDVLLMLTAYQNVELPLTHLPKKERRERVMMALDMVGLSDQADRFPRQLSSPEKRRIVIGRIVASDVPLILADECCTDGTYTGKELPGLLQRLNREFGKTVLLATHYEHARKFSDGVVRLERSVRRPPGARWGLEGIGPTTLTRETVTAPAAHPAFPSAPGPAPD